MTFDPFKAAFEDMRRYSDKNQREEHDAYLKTLSRTERERRILIEQRLVKSSVIDALWMNIEEAIRAADTGSILPPLHYTSGTARLTWLREVKSKGSGTAAFEGYGAVFGNLDESGDIIDHGAFHKSLATLSERKAANKRRYLFPLLWQHEQHMPIGGFTEAREDHTGLYVRGEVDTDTPHGWDAYSAMKKGYLTGLSIGYDPIRAGLGADRKRHLHEIRLHEISAVTFPANPLATIRTVT